MFDLDSLEIFRAVATEGGVIRAARKLHRVPSNVTTRLKQLESRVGAPLFRREGRSMVLSAEGHRLLGYAERLFRMAEEAERELRTGVPGGVFRLGSLESTAGSRLAPILSRFHRLYPGVIVELATGTSSSLVRRVQTFQIEAAFVSEPFTLTGLRTLKVFDEELVLITPKDRPAVKAAADLAGETLVAFEEGCSYRRCLETWLGEAKVMPARTLELASYQAMIACVAAGSGFAAVPRSLLRTLRMGGEVRQHDLPARVRRNHTHLIWSEPASTALRCLIRLIAPEQRPPVVSTTAARRAPMPR